MRSNHIVIYICTENVFYAVMLREHGATGVNEQPHRASFYKTQLSVSAYKGRHNRIAVGHY